MLTKDILYRKYGNQGCFCTGNVVTKDILVQEVCIQGHFCTGSMYPRIFLYRKYGNQGCGGGWPTKALKVKLITNVQMNMSTDMTTLSVIPFWPYIDTVVQGVT